MHKSESACEAPETLKGWRGGGVQSYSGVFCPADKAWVLFPGTSWPSSGFGVCRGIKVHRTISPQVCMNQAHLGLSLEAPGSSSAPPTCCCPLASPGCPHGPSGTTQTPQPLLWSWPGLAPGRGAPQTPPCRPQGPSGALMSPASVPPSLKPRPHTEFSLLSSMSLWSWKWMLTATVSIQALSVFLGSSTYPLYTWEAAQM